MRNPTRKQQRAKQNAIESRENALKNQLKMDENDAQKIEYILSMLLDLDANKARDIIKNASFRYLIQSRKSDTADKQNSLKCPLALHAIVVALSTSGEDINNILSEMSDSAINSLKESIAIAKKQPRPDKAYINNLIAEYKEKQTTKRTDEWHTDSNGDTYKESRALTKNEILDNERKLKSATVTANVIDLWADAIAELNKWSVAVDAFKRDSQTVEQQQIGARKDPSDNQEQGQTVPDEILFMRVGEYLSVRTANRLKEAGIEYICDLIQYGKSNVKKIRGLGPRGYHEIFSYLLPQKLGLGSDITLSDESLQAIKKFKSNLANTDKLDLDIRETNLSNRTKNCLLGSGIDTVKKLIKKTKEELYKIRGFGRRSMVDIEDMLNKMDLKLATPITAKPDLSKIRIADLRFLGCAKNPLIAGGIDTVDKLIKKNKQELRKIRGLGPKAIQNIIYSLEKMGLELAKPTPRKAKTVKKPQVVTAQSKTMLDVKALEAQLAALVELYKNAEEDMANAKTRRLAIMMQIGEQSDDDKKIEQLSDALQTENASIKEHAVTMENLRPAKELSDKLTAAKNAKKDAQKALDAAESTLQSLNTEIAALLAQAKQNSK